VNADDPHLMAATGSFVAPRVLFSADPESPGLARVADGDEAWTVRDGWLVRLSGAREVRVVRSDEVPIGFGGAAPYNLANALGAAASARALGVTDDVLAEGLRGFTSSSADNPGRGNLVRVAGVDVLVDFAHNPDGIRNVLGLVARLRARAPSPPPGGRLAIVGGYAGDRSNESIRDAARAMFDAAPARVFLRDLAGYLRGRAPGEVPQRISAELEALGLARGSIETAPSEGAALRRALEWAAPGDFVVVLAHLETAAVQAVMDEWRAR